MRFLITGGAGFIGSHLAERLILEGPVAVLDDLSTGSMANLARLEGRPHFRFVEGSVMDRALLDELTSQADIVIHLAAAVGVRKILTDPVGAIEVNVDGTKNVLSASLRHRRKVIVASTSEIYGKHTAGELCETADSIIGASSLSRWSYATAKKLDEFLAFGYYQSYGLPVIVTRFFNIIGPRQTGRYGMVLPNFIRAALAGSPIRVFGDGHQTRNFTSIWDCVDALLLLLATPEAEGEVFNIGGSLQVPIVSLANRVKALTDSESPIEFVPYDEAYPEGGFEDMRCRIPCICKIQRVTGWASRIGLDQTILTTARYESGRAHRPFHPVLSKPVESTGTAA